ncbi:NAD(P)/FAD-dependent oxidoreductase [soil metagenome]
MTVRPAWDAIIVGGGHNGLVCAAYLARGGLRTLLLERRENLGGAAATTELLPGVRVPTFAHTVGRLAPRVSRELGLAGHGLRLVQPAARVTSVRPDAVPITLWSDTARTAAGLEAHATPDAAAWTGFDAEVRALASTLWRLMIMPAPDPAALEPDVLLGALRFGWRYRRLDPAHARELSRAISRPLSDWLEDRFASDALRALLATRGRRYTSLGPHDAGSSLHLLTDSAGNAGGAAGETVYARGGPGALAAALAAAARTAGASVRTSAPVARVLDRDGRVEGVVLADGEEVRAPRVISGLDPRTTLLELMDPEALGPELGWEAGNLRASGVTAKVNVALAGLPAFDGLGGDDGRYRLRGRIVVAPSVAHLERASADARQGRPSEQPWLEATIPSLVDPILVDGTTNGAMHVMSILVQSAPAPAAGADEPAQREALFARAMGLLEQAAPGIGALVLAREVHLPGDLERELGTAGGHPMHLESGLDQWFAWRPLLGMAAHRLPLEGLYLCGSGAHPGGGITGLPGRNAARRVLSDLSPVRQPRALAGSRARPRRAR